MFKHSLSVRASNHQGQAAMAGLSQRSNRNPFTPTIRLLPQTTSATAQTSSLLQIIDHTTMEACAEDKFLQVLPLLLGEVRDEKVLCSLLQVSSTVRRALQQARGGCSVELFAASRACEMLRFSSFCSWLSQHSGLVSVVQILPASNITAEHSEMMAHMLQTALQASTARVPGDGEAAPPALQLQEFASGGMTISPVLLSALARTQPQQVDIHVQPRELTAAACAALGTLRSVRRLSVVWLDRCAAARVQDMCAGIGQLTKLAELNLYGVLPRGLQLLPASLQQLSLAMHAEAAGAQLDLAHLTALTELSIQSGSAQVQLPSGVSSLDVLEGSIRLTGPHMPLHVHLVDASSSDLLILQDLSRQQQPWSLELLAPLDAQFAPEAGAALSACTSLTALQIVDEQEDSLPWSRHVAALRRLRQLQPSTSEREEQDLMQLTALAALTRLCMGCDVSDTVAVALALNLTGLCHLELSCGGLRTAGVLPVAAKLTGLQHLHLMYSPNDKAHFGAGDLVLGSGGVRQMFPRPSHRLCSASCCR